MLNNREGKPQERDMDILILSINLVKKEYHFEALDDIGESHWDYLHKNCYDYLPLPFASAIATCYPP